MDFIFNLINTDLSYQIHKFVIAKLQCITFSGDATAFSF